MNNNEDFCYSKKECYNGLKTERKTVESSSILNASIRKINAKTSNNDWVNEEHTLTVGAAGADMATPSRIDNYWQSATDLN